MYLQAAADAAVDVAADERLVWMVVMMRWPRLLLIAVPFGMVFCLGSTERKEGWKSP
jgi:hypothetical protein